MKILSHRGYWKELAEKNTPAAFERSFALGYGTETDFRDYLGRLVIAHDIPDSENILAEECFTRLAAHDRHLPLAVNIKADGLQKLLKSGLERHGIDNYFLFDMSVPDAVFSIKSGLRVFTRHSDVEPVPAFYEQAAGVWMDMFFDDKWLTVEAIGRHLDAGKQVCLVSPELHKRSHQAFWDRLAGAQFISHHGLMLCTDIPEAAQAFFSHA